MKSKELSIIIYSCKKNADMWTIFSKLFKKYWGDCQYELVLLTDAYPKDTTEEYAFTQIVECDSSWSDMIKMAIEKVQTPYVMLFMDDYLLCDYVNNDDIEDKLNIVKKYHVANLRMVESPMIISDKFELNNKLGYYKPGTAYSISTQVGIWDVEFLKRNIKDGWSAWDFERTGSIDLVDEKQPLLSTLDYVFPYEEGVRRGKWMDNGVRLCKRNNIELDFVKRPAMTNWELAKIYFKGAIIEANPTLVVKIQNRLAKKKKK